MKTKSQTRAANRPVPSQSVGHQVAPVVNSANQAFSIDLIREKILDYAIHSGALSLQDTRSCRLVHSSSLETISKLLRYNREPLFHFSLDQDNPLLDQFIKTVTGEANAATQPFKLYLEPGFFIQPNFQHLVRLLTQCGDGLVELDIIFPGDGGSMLFFFPTALHFPRLQKISATFSELADDIASGQTAGLVYLLQPIMHGCRELKTFYVPFAFHKGLNPAGFANLKLPPTLTEVDLSYQFGSKELQILINNPLPRLKKLEILQAHLRLDSELIYRILEKCRHSLESFTVGGIIHDEIGTRQPTLYSFPVMPKLKYFEIYALDWQLPEDLQKGSMQQCLPNLKTLSLTTDPDFDEIDKWTQGQRFESVTKLYYRLQSHWIHNWSTPSYDVLCLNRAFPNVTILDILIEGDEVDGLKTLFEKMTRLTNLSVEVCNTAHVTDCATWDLVLIGNYLKQEYPTIRNLKELQKLCLKTVRSPPRLRNVSLISPSVFKRSLFQMPNLTELVFRGRFRVTPSIEQQWKNDGRRIFYAEE